MQLSADATLAFPRPVVFRTYRDKLADLLRYLPNVRAIEVKSRKDEGSVVSMLNVWRAGGEIPAAARAFISESMLSWDDHARWDETKFTCAWRIVPHSFTEAVHCQGENEFVELDGKTTLRIRGELRVDAAKLRGVPRLLAARVGKLAEEILADKIRPNLLGVSDGVRKYLEDQR